MLPSLAGNNVLNSPFGNFQFTSEARKRSPLGVLHFSSDHSDIVFGELGSAMSFPKDVVVSALGVHVGAVVCMGAKPQMIGVNAPAIVAGMADAQSIGNITFEHQVSGTISNHGLSIKESAGSGASKSAELEMPVPASVIGHCVFSRELLLRGLFVNALVGKALAFALSFVMSAAKSLGVVRTLTARNDAMIHDILLKRM